MKRLVYIIGELGLGGSEHQLYLLLKGMDKRRFQLHVIIFHASPNFSYETALKAMGIRVYLVSAKKLLSRLWEVYQILREIRPDVVHSWSYYTNPFAGIAGLFAAVPIRFGSLRGSLSLAAEQYTPFKHFWAKYAVQKIVCNSAYLRDELLQVHYPPERILILPNVIESADFAQAKAADIGTDKPVVGIIANLRREKNLHFFVRAMICAMQKKPDFVAVIVGQAVPVYPEIEGELRALIAANGLEERIRLLGFRQDTPRLLKRMSVFCLSSDSESMPNVVLEAMAAGLPVVARPVGAIPELVVNGETGYLVTTVPEMAERVLALLENPEKARIFGLKAQTMIQDYRSSESIAEALCRMYQ